MRFNALVLWMVAAMAIPRLGSGDDFSSTFFKKNCLDCHDADTKKGALDLTALKFEPKNPQNFATWVTIHDRVTAGEMPPPKKKERPEPVELNTFTNILSSFLTASERERTENEGRATQRRLNRYEYENTLRDLLSLPALEVKAYLPEDRERFGFNKVGDALDVSYVQMARYLSAADFALHQAMAPQVTRPQTRNMKYYTWDQGGFFKRIDLKGPLNRRTFPLVGLELQRDLMVEKPSEARKKEIDDNPSTRTNEAMALVVSTYEPTEIQFNGFRAPVSGYYRLKFSGYSVWMGLKFDHVSEGHRPEPVTIYADSPPRQLRKLGSFDFNREPTVCEMKVWLMAGETIRPDAARLFRSRPPDFKNPLAEADGMPGVAFQWMNVEGPLIDEWPPAGQKLLFGDLPIVSLAAKNPRGKTNAMTGVEVISKNPKEDAPRLMEAFLKKAYRRPVTTNDTERFTGVVRSALKHGSSFTDSMIAGYTAVLSSPGFLYLSEKPGRLDDSALAERLSYFLWNSPPDAELRRVADQGHLHEPEILDAQVERLLNDPRSRRFVNAFLDYWLDLRFIADTAPDTELYPEYQLDDLLVESMTAETQTFFAEMIRRNLGATNLVASDFAMLNERLATLYDIPEVSGVELRDVPLPKDSLRGGILTQASVLKVTANGTTTSPVKRGAWVMSRLLGKPPPPPPPGVPTVEPDIRGATTIRDQLARHRKQETCAACHRNIDPAGFALESFDVMGAYRAHYRSVGNGERIKGSGHNGLVFHYCTGVVVDPSGELPDGGKFQNVSELRQQLLKHDEQLARNLAQQLIVYATGAPVGFADRPALAKILADSRESGYGVRTLIHEIVRSDLLLNK